MKLLENEAILWESKNKRFLLTSHRLREMKMNMFGSIIKSIMLEELTFSELRPTRNLKFAKMAVLSFIVLNGIVYLSNHYLFNAEIVKLLLGEIHIDQVGTKIIFYVSLAISFVFILLYLLSIKKVYCFFAGSNSIQFQLRWMSFKDRESFISKVEAAKAERVENLAYKINV